MELHYKGLNYLQGRLIFLLTHRQTNTRQLFVNLGNCVVKIRQISCVVIVNECVISMCNNAHYNTSVDRLTNMV